MFALEPQVLHFNGFCLFCQNTLWLLPRLVTFIWSSETQILVFWLHRRSIASKQIWVYCFTNQITLMNVIDINFHNKKSMIQPILLKFKTWLCYVRLTLIYRSRLCLQRILKFSPLSVCTKLSLLHSETFFHIELYCPFLQLIYQNDWLLYFLFRLY